MSMTAITAFQLLAIAGAYFVICILGPHLVVGKTIRFRNRYERFMMYTVLGNFYIINLVYVLEILHISHPITLILFTVIPGAYIKIKLEHIPFKNIVLERWNTFRKIVGGQLKIKAYRDANKSKRDERKTIISKYLIDVYAHNFVDIFLVIGTVIATFWAFGINQFEYYGYKLSDVVVHEYWINQLSENDIFTKGVYPYGYHNVIYYIHEIFRIDTYVILRLYSIVVLVWLVLVMLCFLKLLCKAKYLPYLACFAYTFINCFEAHTYSPRFASMIPQEYAMLFVLPSFYCGFEYFREQLRENRRSAANRSYIFLAGFLCSFSTVLSTHFYAFIATGIGCAAMAIGFGFYFVRRQYFTKILTTVMLAVVVSVLPLVVCYVGGKDLEYSLKWGLSVIKGEDINQGEISDAGEDTEATEESYDYGINISRSYYVDEYGFFLGNIIASAEIIVSYLDYGDIAYSNRVFIYVIFLSFFFMIAIGLAICFIKGKDRIYGMTLVTMGILMIFMTLLVSAGGLGLVQLMDLNRASIFFAFLVGPTFVLFIDSVFYITIGNLNRPVLYNILSLTLLLITFGIIIQNGLIRERLSIEGFESNDAVICLGKIISDSKDDSWTICSANDEGRMVYGHGFHYELIDFLRGMEYIGNAGWVRIPSETVYFFIEKRPIDYYYFVWEGSGTSISEVHARKNLPLGNNRALYEYENRWICMSRIYYWAEAFRELYPNETTVYYETDDFICYRIEQNPYRLFNFAIDYGYNTSE